MRFEVHRETLLRCV